MGENSDENSKARVWEVEGCDNGDGDGFDAKVDNGKDDDNLDEVLIKRMISDHPFFDLLIQTHINCLKVGLGTEFEGEDEDFIDIATNKSLLNVDQEANAMFSSSPGLDQFMETYCMALEKLKEAIEEPLKDSISFINNMYAQLDNLTLADQHEEV